MAIKECPNCGKKISDNWKSCPFCHTVFLDDKNVEHESQRDQTITKLLDRETKSLRLIIESLSCAVVGCLLFLLLLFKSIQEYFGIPLIIIGIIIVVASLLVLVFSIISYRDAKKQLFDRKQNEDIPNETTLAAIKEVEEMEKNPNGVKRYKSADELIEDLNKE